MLHCVRDPSFPTGDWTHAPAMEARILNYWASGEVPGFSSSMELCLHCLTHAINSEHRWLPHTALSYSKNLQFILKILKEMGPTWMCPSVS